jgi:hypothetical protein
VKRSFEVDSAQLATLGQADIHHCHHARGLLSRRPFLGTAVGAGLSRPLVAAAAQPFNSVPKPTSNAVSALGVGFQVTFPGPAVDPSTITGFNGFVGAADVQGTGTATDRDGSIETLLFDTDMRVMSGVYVGQDGRAHKRTFGFV